MPALIGLLRLIPWWVWPVAALAGWGWWQQNRADRYEAQLDEIRAEYRAKDLVAEETSRLLKMSAARAKGERDAENTSISRRLADAQRELRNRPERRPEAATAACEGATGRQLSRPDSEFLYGLAARADRLRAALKECYAWVDTVNESQP